MMIFKVYFLLVFIKICQGSLNVTSKHKILNEDLQHPCIRVCKLDDPPMKCRYKFVIDWYQTLSRACYDCPKNITDCSRPDCVTADGGNRSVVVVNRRLPGPSIQVCAGDEIIVDLENHMEDTETTIHWHGVHQKGSPYMDGVPFVTQCPIMSGTRFTYKFIANEIGTQFWHSHSGSQRGDGVYGSLIIRASKQLNPHNTLYDFDLPSHVIVVNDWIQEPVQSLFTKTYHSDGKIAINTLLVNGFGYFMDTESKVGVPPARFTVKKGFRYRFRLINAGFNVCPIEISVDNHNITVISTDGFDVQPLTITSFVSYTGERFDFIINANQEIKKYWIRFRGLLKCANSRTHQVAVLDYEDSDDLQDLPEGEPTFETAHKNGPQLNSIADDMNLDDSINIYELNSTYEDDITLKQEADYKFYLYYDFYNVTNTRFYSPGLYEYNKDDPKFRMTTPQINQISFGFPPFPVLSQRESLTPDMFCNETTVKNCSKEFCQCTHVLQVPLNSVVEIILIDLGKEGGDENHPFHLHGYGFRVIGMEKFNDSISLELIKELDDSGKLIRKLQKAPKKDTVTVPQKGYTIARFLADNPGYWLFHCHIDFHASLGMLLVFKVGEHKDFPPVPRNFPQCGNWEPQD